MLIVLSMVPSAILYVILCRCAKVKKDSLKFLLKLICFGGLSALAAAAVSLLMDDVVFSFLDQENVLYKLFDMFIVVALVEELAKFYAIKLPTWKSAAFTHTANAAVYIASAAAGFGIVENIVYMMFNSNLRVAIIRGLLGAMAHMMDAAFMGYYYGLMKYADAAGDGARARAYMKKALLIPILFHGGFDFLLGMSDYTALLLLFFALYIFEIVLAIKTYKKAFRENKPISGGEQPAFAAAAGGDQCLKS